MAEYEAPYVAVGQTVQWFPHGKLTEKPVAAIVIAVMDAPGVIEIRTIGRAGAGRWSSSVRHINDPFFKTASPEYLESRGSWRHIPVPQERSIASVMPAKETKPR